jgi:hypothetical protein
MRMPDPVSDTLCRERQRVQDERFARDKERIEDLEKICEKLNRLSIEMGELIKKHDEELNHQSRRLQVIEQKPLRWWEKFAGAVITALGSAVGGGMLVVWVENILQKIKMSAFFAFMCKGRSFLCAFQSFTEEF